jgi:hypothetical protein
MWVSAPWPMNLCRHGCGGDPSYIEKLKQIGTEARPTVGDRTGYRQRIKAELALRLT